ncbi:hypothetical protein V8D89_001266 [Ganoderma adspersum]
MHTAQRNDLNCSPPGPVELDLFAKFSSDFQLAECSAVGDRMVEFAKWASTAVPSLRLSCRVACDEDRQWQDLSHGDGVEDVLFGEDEFSGDHDGEINE